MKCPYCAETIQDEAILCRFCGARKDGDGWATPAPRVADAPASPSVSGMTRFTMVSAGVLFLLSACWGLVTITSEAPLFGALRGGLVAVLYNGFHVVLFTAMGVALLRPGRRGYLTVLVGTAVYCCICVGQLLDRGARVAQYQSTMDSVGGVDPAIVSMFDRDTVLYIEDLVTAGVVLCWLGFAAYVYVRRAYFLGAPQAA